MARGTWQGGGTWQTSGGGGLVLAVVIAAVLIGSGAASAAVSALVTIVIVLGCVTGLAVLGGVAWLVYRAKVGQGASCSTFRRARSGLTRSDGPGPPIAAPSMAAIPPESRPQLSESHKLAIGPGREVHLHLNVTPGELAAILRHYDGED